jgi:hypothetical protein
MTAAQQRKLQRTVHLATGLMLVATIYGPNLGHFHDFVRLVALPLLVLTGIAMWQAPRIRRLRKRIAGVLATPRADEDKPPASAGPHLKEITR